MYTVPAIYFAGMFNPVSANIPNIESSEHGAIRSHIEMVNDLGLLYLSAETSDAISL